MNRAEKLTNFGLLLHRLIVEEEFENDKLVEEDNIHERVQSTDEGVQVSYCLKLKRDNRIKVVLKIAFINDYFYIHATSSNKEGVKIKLPEPKFSKEKGTMGQSESSIDEIRIYLKEHLIFPLLFLIKSKEGLPIGKESLDFLNDDCLLKVFGYVNCPATLARLPQVSKRFSRISEDNVIKKKLWSDLIECKFSYKCDSFQTADIQTIKNTYKLLNRNYHLLRKDTLNGASLSSQFQFPFVI